MTSVSKMDNVLPRLFALSMIPACVGGGISREITLTGQDQMEELLAQAPDLVMIIPMAQI